MSRLSPRERALLAAGAAALVLSALVFGLARPMLARSRQLAREAESLRAELEEAAAIREAAPEIEEELARLRAAAADIARPAGYVAPQLVRDIEALSARLGVSLTRVRPGEPQPSAGCMKYPITFEFESSYDQMVRMLYELEQPAERLWVEGAEISSVRGTPGRLRTVIHAYAYVLGLGDAEGEGGDGAEA